MLQYVQQTIIYSCEWCWLWWASGLNGLILFNMWDCMSYGKQRQHIWYNKYVNFLNLYYIFFTHNKYQFEIVLTNSFYSPDLKGRVNFWPKRSCELLT